MTRQCNQQYALLSVSDYNANDSVPTSSTTPMLKAHEEELTVRKKKGADNTATQSKRGNKRLPTAIVSTSTKRIRQASEHPTIRSTSLTDASLFLTAPGVLQTMETFASLSSEKVRDNLNSTNTFSFYFYAVRGK
jgi:hypothetical protein